MLRQMIPNRMCSSSESIPSCLEIEKEGLALTLINIALDNLHYIHVDSCCKWLASK